MKSKLRCLIIPFSACIVFACSFSSSAAAQTNEPITGGFGTVEVTDKDVQAAARYAVKKQTDRQRTTIRLISIDKAERQVVAGLNYRLCLTVEYRVKGKKTRRTAEALVYKNLKQKLSLSSFTEHPDGCPNY